jgi:hypothetical protein
VWNDGAETHFFDEWPVYNPAVEDWWNQEKEKYSKHTITLPADDWPYAITRISAGGPQGSGGLHYHLQWKNVANNTYIPGYLVSFYYVPRSDRSWIQGPSSEIVECPSGDCVHFIEEYTVIEPGCHRTGVFLDEKMYGRLMIYRHFDAIYRLDTGTFSQVNADVWSHSPDSIHSHFITDINPGGVVSKGVTPHFVSCVVSVHAHNYSGATVRPFQYESTDRDVKFFMSSIHEFNETPDLSPSSLVENTALTQKIMDRITATESLSGIAVDAFSFMGDEPEDPAP